MEEKRHPLGDLMNVTMEKIRAMADANTVIGEPIVAGEVTIIPVSKVSYGFGVGGGEYATKNQKPDRNDSFGGGTGAGVTIMPMGFLVVRGTTVKLLPVAPPPDGALDRVVDMVPDLVDKVTDFVEKQQQKKESTEF